MNAKSVVYPGLFLLLLAIGSAFKGLTVADESTDWHRIEKEIFAYLNLERQLIDLPPLAVELVLQQIAVEHNRKMIEMNELAHEFSGYPPLVKRLQTRRVLFTLCGENVGWSDSNLARFIHRGLMESPPHRANILNARFTHCGIAVEKKGERWFITQEFAALPPLEEVDAVERGIRERVDSLLAKSGDTIAWILQDNWIMRSAARGMLKERYPGSEYAEKGCRVTIYPAHQLENVAKDIAVLIRRERYHRGSVGVAINTASRRPGRTPYYYLVAFRGCKE